ncbi:MAG: DUF924 domain-containing protein [Burkholderiales bacterium]|nr:DUF924 domain-containing protein [Burkholderiales bacterium]
MTPGFAPVLAFWFGGAGSAESGRPRDCWFRKSDAFDAEIRERFGALHGAAHAGALDAWAETPLAALALLVVLDQFPRNLYRGTPRAFASDARALAVARKAVWRGFDRVLAPVARWFVYLPFEHAEDLTAQRESLRLFARLAGDPASATAIDYARRHYDVIARFGRFPHRNAILGRPSTPEEAEYLRQPGSGF